ncbi:hypothetical protein M2275_000792 [Rhodococcus opacus]|nr:hypothetical protein [Rhodococcus opacus]
MVGLAEGGPDRGDLAYAHRMTAWIEVLKALTAGPELPIRGTIREVRPDGYTEGFAGASSGPSPMLVVTGDGCRVWRHGNRLRVERGDGRLTFVTDGIQAWDFTADSERPRTGPPDRVHYLGSNQFLLQRRSAADWSGDDFTTPTGPVEETEFADRECWTVELAPPPHKPYPLRIWVDTASGQMLGYRSEHAGQGAQFVDLVVGEDFDDGLFGWDGPVYTPEEYQRRLKDQHLTVQREHAAWFSEAVTASPIGTRVPVDFTPDSFPFRDPETGAFDAFNRDTLLSRRPRSEDGWTPNWGPLHYVWSTPDWDWAAGGINLDLDDEAIRLLQRSLHPEEPVDRQRKIDPPGRGRTK